MKIASFDIGIKNLAVCVLEQEKSENKFDILYWDVINVIPESSKVKSVKTDKLVKSIIESLDKLNYSFGAFEDIDQIILELQPKCNQKMKLVSHVVYTYFVTRKTIDERDPIEIKFFRAKNKLNVYKGPEIYCRAKGAYAKRKYQSIQYSQLILKKMEKNDEYDFFLSNKKKDDLADCLLQGLTYLKLTYNFNKEDLQRYVSI